MPRKLTTVRLQCDDCGAMRQGRLTETIEQLRTALASVGWGHAPDSDYDVCQACVAQVEPAKALALV